MARIIQVSDDWVEIYDDGDNLVFEGHRPPDTIYAFAGVIKDIYGKVIETKSYEDDDFDYDTR